MIGLSQYNLDRQVLPDASVAVVRPEYKADRSAVRTDFALLASALFLQRFSLPYGNTFVPLELVAIGLILAHQFVAGRLLIQYDRLLWFLVLAFALTCSLWVNFKSTMLSGYLLFVTFFFYLHSLDPQPPANTEVRFRHFNSL